MKKVLGILMSAAFIIAVIWVAKKLPFTASIVGNPPAPSA